MEVKNINVSETNIKYKDSKYKSLIEKNIHLLPILNKKILKFELINSNEAFANAIRRVFNDELLIKCLNTSIFNIKTDDKYILHDTIIERLNSISIKQDIPDDIEFQIKVTNNTDGIIKIYTKDIINKKAQDYLIGESKNKNIYFNPNILLCTLKPNKFLFIDKIVINKEYGYNNNIYSLGSYKYQILNTDFKELSLNVESTDFELQFITNGNIELNALINNIYDNLYFRLIKVQTAINDYELEKNSSDVNKIINEIFIINNNNIYEIHINNEYHTIGNLLTYYIYKLDPSIELINYKLEHPLRHKIIVNIKHINYKKLCNDAINIIIKDLDKFKKYFNKI